jgi:glycosyltransferase involved in cell wall biosynthesis
MTELNLGVDTSLFQAIDRDRRPSSIAHLLEHVAAAPRGKTSRQSAQLLERLPRIGEPAEFTGEVGLCTDYDAKRPDADLEAKLSPIDWHHDKVILFVGRLIANKGIQTVIAALPRIIDAVACEQPELADLMKLSPDPLRVTGDIATRVPKALALQPEPREVLRRFAEQRYDWSSVATKLAETLLGLE